MAEELEGGMGAAIAAQEMTAAKNAGSESAGEEEEAREEGGGRGGKGAAAEETKSRGKKSGRVKWFSNAKGFGFIQPDEEGGAEGGDVFVHQAAVHARGFRSLQEGEAVEYEVEVGEDGRPRATAVTGPSGCHVLGRRRRSSRPQASSACFACGGTGHLARHCPSGHE